MKIIFFFFLPNKKERNIKNQQVKCYGQRYRNKRIKDLNNKQIFEKFIINGKIFTSKLVIVICLNCLEQMERNNMTSGSEK